MADFNYYLNRQGIRGLQGVKGDQGDSPIITVQTETPNEYVLKITNPDGTELISPNLRGNKININEGTYVRYNTETGELYTSTADGATGELAGVVRLATDVDITNMDERAVVTPSQLADALSQYLVSPDGSVKIVQHAENSLTELTVESTGQVIDKLKSDVSILQNEVSVLNTEMDTKSPKLIEGENITLTPQEDGTITIAAESTVPTNMVTTDTSQTITGLKTFGGTDLSKILLEGSESLISFRQNSDSLPTTLIGGFFDSNGKKSITIGSTDHETLSLNAKSVQDGSGNEFITSSNFITFCQNNAEAIKAALGL